METPVVATPNIVVPKVGRTVLVAVMYVLIGASRAPAAGVVEEEAFPFIALLGGDAALLFVK
jgi:hypothetical protein